MAFICTLALSVVDKRGVYQRVWLKVQSVQSVQQVSDTAGPFGWSSRDYTTTVALANATRPLGFLLGASPLGFFAGDVNQPVGFSLGTSISPLAFRWGLPLAFR